MDVDNNEQELSSVEGPSTTDMMAYLSLTEKEKALSPRYLAEKDSYLKKFLEWQEQDQTDFIRVCLQKMRHQQHGQIDLFLKPMLQRDFITLLPTGLAENVLSMLDAKSLCACAQVSKSWRRAIAHGMLWRKLIERKVRTDSLWRGLSDKRGWKKFLFISKEQATYLVSLAHGMSKVEAEEMKRNYPDPLEFQHLFYRNLYPQIERDITTIENNWRNGNHRLQRINCQSENSKGVYCLQYDDEKIVSGLRDNTIKIWNRSDLSCTKVLTGHTGSVLCLQYDDRVIASGSSDATVRIWDVQTGQQLNTLIHHCEAVLHLRFQNGMLVTCSKDRSIAVWNMISPQEIDLRRVLVGHRAAVNVVDFDQTYIVSASGDRTIKVWSADTCEFVRTLNGHRRGIACLQYRDRLIVSGSSDNSIRLWDIESGACLRVLEGHEELVRCIRFDSKRIVSGAYDGKIKVWDLQAALDPRSAPSSICLKTLVEHTGRVFRLQFDEFQIVSSSHDDTILIWDFLNTGPNNHLPGTSTAPPAAHHRRAAPPIDGMFDGQAANNDLGANIDPGVGMGGLNIPGPLLPLQPDDDWDHGRDAAHMQPIPGPAGEMRPHVARMRVNHHNHRPRMRIAHRPIGDIPVLPQDNFPAQINFPHENIFEPPGPRENQAAEEEDAMDDSEDSAEDAEIEHNPEEDNNHNNAPNQDEANRVNDYFEEPEN